MQKALGGDRLGSGNKMNVEQPEYGYSTVDMSYLWRSTGSAGTLIPFMVQLGQPGDEWDIDLNAMVLTHPTVGPLFGSMKVQLDILTADIRLYQGILHNNQTGTGLQMENVKMPIITLQGKDWVAAHLPNDVNNAQINPSCILAYGGIRGVGSSPEGAGPVKRDFNAWFILAYWDIFKNYYSNKQEEMAWVIHNSLTTQSEWIDTIEVNGGEIQPRDGVSAPSDVPLVFGSIIRVNATASIHLDQLRSVLIETATGIVPLSELGEIVYIGASEVQLAYNASRWGALNTARYWQYSEAAPPTNDIKLYQFPLTNLDTMRRRILAHAVNDTPFSVNEQLLDPYNLLFEQNSGVFSREFSQEGLAVKTYQSDLYNNWLRTEWIDGPGGINEITAIDTSTGEFTVADFIISKKMYELLNNIATSGGTVDDWYSAAYREDQYGKPETPVYHGGLSKELIFQEVVSNSSSAANGQSGEQPLGTLAGRGTLGSKHKGGRVNIRVKEHTLIMGIISITPRIDYSQGNNWINTAIMTMDDFRKPAMDQIGFEELITEGMTWWDTQWDPATNTWKQKSAGKQPSWMNYRTNVNQVYGNFANDQEGFMVLKRDYTPVFEDDTYHIDDLTTYIDPVKYNHIFAQTSLDSQNYWLQISVDAKVRRKISQRVMPKL